MRGIHDDNIAVIVTSSGSSCCCQVVKFRRDRTSLGMSGVTTCRHELRLIGLWIHNICALGVNRSSVSGMLSRFKSLARDSVGDGRGLCVILRSLLMKVVQASWVVLVAFFAVTRRVVRVRSVARVHVSRLCVGGVVVVCEAVVSLVQRSVVVHSDAPDDGLGGWVDDVVKSMVKSSVGVDFLVGSLGGKHVVRVFVGSCVGVRCKVVRNVAMAHNQAFVVLVSFKMVQHLLEVVQPVFGEGCRKVVGRGGRRVPKVSEHRLEDVVGALSMHGVVWVDVRQDRFEDVLVGRVDERVRVRFHESSSSRVFQKFVVHARLFRVLDNGMFHDFL
mmetsp:Transcript_30233/g.42162  ORF Transcript_30233/g.42162 Transcript_30233/m.42162 type:complete len:331 (+) Transcript_30233:342-1334(+)